MKIEGAKSFSESGQLYRIGCNKGYTGKVLAFQGAHSGDLRVSKLKLLQY